MIAAIMFPTSMAENVICATNKIMLSTALL